MNLDQRHALDSESARNSRHEPGHRRRVVAAGFVGNVLEWYDFAVYGFFAATIGTQFFPSDDPTSSLIASFGAFAAGFLMRPVGAILFGHIGDRFGRKRALTLSILLMALPTFAVGLLPTHASVGATAGILMVLMRLLQGVSVGGEYTSSFVFLVEHAPAQRRTLFGSFSLLGATAGILLGSSVGALISTVTDDAQLAAWGWRVPFLSGIVLAAVGMLIRRGILDTPVPERPARAPLAEMFANHRRQLLQSFGLNAMSAVVFYTVFIYLATWMVEQDGLTNETALDINTLSMVTMGVSVAACAWLADRVGRKPFLFIGAGGIALFGYPLVWWMHHPDPVLVACGQTGFALLLGCFCSVMPAILTELFPRAIRVSGASLGYNLPYALFGGTAPLVAAWLVGRNGDALAIAWPLIGFSAVAFLVALTLPKERPLG